MKKLFFITIALVSLFVVNSCKERKTSNVISVVDTTDVDVPDSTIYGICGDGTTMHNLQLITDAGDTMNVFIDDEEPNIVKGGLLAGDRIALILNGQKNEELGDVAAQQVINLDKNFEIIEGGEVKNNVKAEQNPWTSWKILNGKLLLNKDTFMIDELGPDSMYLENNAGIFTFKRQV